MPIQSKLDAVLPGNRGDEQVATAGSAEKSQLQYDLTEEEIAALEEAKKVAAEADGNTATVTPIREVKPIKRVNRSKEVNKKPGSKVHMKADDGSQKRVDFVGKSIVLINDTFDQTNRYLNKHGYKKVARWGGLLKKAALTGPAVLLVGRKLLSKRKSKN